MFDKIKCWLLYSLLSAFWITWLPLVVWWFAPDVGGFYFSTLYFLKMEYIGQDYFDLFSKVHHIIIIILYFVSLKELFDGFGILKRDVDKWSVGLGEFTSRKEKRKAKRKIGWGVSSFVLFKIYLPGLLTVAGITNGLFLWMVVGASNQALVIAVGCFLLSFFISNLCGDYDEKINRIRDTIDYEFRNRSRYHGMREYIEDSDPYYYQELPPPRRQPRQQTRFQRQPRRSRSWGQFTQNQRRPPLRRRPEPPPEPLYYEQDYQEDYYDQPPQEYQASEPYQPPQRQYYEPPQYQQGQQHQPPPDSFEDVLGDAPPIPPTRQQNQNGNGNGNGRHTGGGRGGLTEGLGKLFKHNRKRPF